MNDEKYNIAVNYIWLDGMIAIRSFGRLFHFDHRHSCTSIPAELHLAKQVDELSSLYSMGSGSLEQSRCLILSATVFGNVLPLMS